MHRILLTALLLAGFIVGMREASAATVYENLAIDTGINPSRVIRAGDSAQLFLRMTVDGRFDDFASIQIFSGDGQQHTFNLSGATDGSLSDRYWSANFVYTNPGIYQPSFSFNVIFELQQTICGGSFGCITFYVPTLRVGAGDFEQSLTVLETPLPAALPLFATALAGGGVMAWRRRKPRRGATERCRPQAR